MVDTTNMNVSAVAVPVTGHIGIAPQGAGGPSPVEGAALGYKLPVSYIRPGLLKEDGGFEWTMEADGDPIVFWQDGYSIPSGLANVSVKVIFAQTDAIVMEIIRGKKFDSNGYMTVDGGGTSAKYSLFTEEIFKNGDIRRRWAPNAGVQEVKEQKSERGSVYGYEVTFSISRADETENNHFGEWLIPNSTNTAVPTISSAEPSGAAAGDTVTISGSGFTGTTGVQFGSTNATSFEVTSPTTVMAVVPAGSAGSAQIKVTTPNGVATLPYTRG